MVQDQLQKLEQLLGEQSLAVASAGGGTKLVDSHL